MERQPNFFDNPQHSPSHWLQVYLEALESERNASEHTRINYQIDLRQWIQFLIESPGQDPDDPKDFWRRATDLKLMRKFLSSQKKKYEATTVSRRLSAIKGFLKFLYREGVIDSNVSSLIDLPKAADAIPHVLREDQVRELIESQETGSLKQKRTKAILELLYSTGMRVSELVGLTREKIDLRHGTALVFGKGKKERLLPLGRHCQNALRDYISSVPSHDTGPKTPVFMNRDGGALSVRSVQRDLRQAAVTALGAAGAEVSPHTFRHSCATHLLSRGAGIREIQELLGHSTLVTTQKYTQVDSERLRKTYEASHPKGKQRKPRKG